MLTPWGLTQLVARAFIWLPFGPAEPRYLRLSLDVSFLDPRNRTGITSSVSLKQGWVSKTP